jgi:molybdopterin-guanine dinucleotide biosynthesis protein A
MNGQNKALLSVGTRSIISRQIDLFQKMFEQVIVVSNHPLDFASWEITVVSDLYSLRSSLTGIHAGLFYSRWPQAFVSACDMPFLKKEMIDIILRDLDPNLEIIVPKTVEGYQPLCAVYSRRCLPWIEKQLKSGLLKISGLFPKMKVKTIPENVLRSLDPDLISFFNINTQEDLNRSQTLFSNLEAS